MKLQISYDFTNLSQAIEIAKKTAEFSDIIEIGTPLLISEGVKAISEFKQNFPTKPILADVKLVDRVSEIIPLIAKAGATHITMLYGTSNKVIQKAASTAHANGLKIVLDLINPETMGQAAHDAEILKVDYVLFHYPHDFEQVFSHLDQWEIVRGNTDLPVFVSGRIKKEHISEIMKLKPQGIVVGEGITRANDPIKEAEFFKAEISK